MIQIEDKTRCTGCHACATACPRQCITMQADSEGFLYPVIDATRCTSCGRCTLVCPMDKTVPDDMQTKAYAAANRDKAILKSSSSGGVFTALAQAVLAKGGIVVGAAFDERLHVAHRTVSTEAELCVLRGSKYVQSEIGSVFAELKTALLAGTPVLFSGTPCQVAGLVSFLERPYEQLYLVDFICHGVPSPLVWQTYLQSLHLSYPARADFRDKRKGATSFSLVVNGKSYGTKEENAYLRVFLCDLSLRPSCYDCAFKTASRHADITLADFWGARHNPEVKDLYDRDGLSLVITHSAKGEALLAGAETLSLREVHPEPAIADNMSYLRSVRKPDGRDAFLQGVAESPRRTWFLTKQKWKWRTMRTKAARLYRKVCGKLRRMLHLNG